MSGWPPPPHLGRLLDELAALVERAGAARFLDAPVVRADERDFPEPWRPTAAALERLLLRLLWHAHVDLDVVLDDRRGPRREVGRLRTTELELVEVVDGAARFEVAEIGNDDLAGHASNLVGDAFLRWTARSAPYREAAIVPTPAEATLAAIYLGLGVLVANASSYARRATELQAQWVISEDQHVAVGGLGPTEACFLVAVQAVVRPAPVDALATLRPNQRARVSAFVDELTPHRAPLAARLGLDLDAPRPALARDPAPPTVDDAARPEPDLERFNRGHVTFRVGHHHGGLGLAAGAAVGLVAGLGLAGTLVAPVVTAIAIAPMFAGLAWGRQRRYWLCADPACGRRVPRDAATCPGCGGAVAGELRHADERLAAEEELDARAGDGEP